ncbi:MAG: DUF3846 domain-containing protein, partial [Poseidonia sp.]
MSETTRTLIISAGTSDPTRINDPDAWVSHADGPGLGYLQAAVGGLIEAVGWLPRPFDDLFMWAHEEALLTPFPVLNHLATRMAGRPIYGDVVVVRD